MNKKSLILCIILILSGLQSYSQEKMTTHLENGYLIGQAIVPLKGKTADEIYKSSLIWEAKTFREKDIQSKIKDQMIRIRGLSRAVNFTHVVSSGFVIHFFYLYYTLQINIKDEKLKVEAYRIAYYNTFSYLPAEQYLYRKDGKLKGGQVHEKVKKQTDAELSRLLNSLVKTIKGQKKDNW